MALTLALTAAAQADNGTGGIDPDAPASAAPAPAPAPAAPATDPAQDESAKAGGRAYGEPLPMSTPTVPGAVAQIIDGVAYAPADAPLAVKQVIWSANQIVGMPYIYGGGHRKGFVDRGYDCSGTVSYALHGGALLRSPRDSRSFYRFGSAGLGQWITIYTNPGHAYMTVAGIRLDTSAADDPSGRKGPQWRPLRKSDAGYKVRHPVGF